MSDSETAPPPAKKARAPECAMWFCTLNNPDLHPVDLIAYFEMLDPKRITIARFIRLAHEVGESGTPHLHACIALSRKMSTKALSRILPSSDLRPMRRWDKALEYVAKDGFYVESGIEPSSGLRVDLSRATSAALAGVRTLPFVLSSNPNLQAFTMYNKVKALLPPPSRPDVTVVWLWGDTGTGKSYWVDQLSRQLGQLPYGHCDERGKFFDGYVDQSWALFDDINPRFSRKILLKVCDRYRLRVEVKGSSTAFAANVIFLTSDRHPSDWIGEGDRDEHYSIPDVDQLCRRVHFWGHCSRTAGTDGPVDPAFYTQSDRHGARHSVPESEVITAIKKATKSALGPDDIPRPASRMVAYAGPGGPPLEHLLDLCHDPEYHPEIRR